MSVEVLHPQDLFAQRFRIHPTSFHHRRNFPENRDLPSSVVYRKQRRKTSPRPGKKKIKASAETDKSSQDGSAEPWRKVDVADGGIVMGKVTLLRRGESLSSLVSTIEGGNPNLSNQKSIDDIADLDAVRSGPPSPEIVPKQLPLVAPPSGDIYAGTAFFSSPSPRSVPLPSFFNKKDPNDCNNNPSFDGATRDLRRMLRLE